MTPTLEQAFVAIAQLSETEQEQLAEILLLGISQLKEKQKVEAQKKNVVTCKERSPLTNSIKSDAKTEQIQ